MRSLSGMTVLYSIPAVPQQKDALQRMLGMGITGPYAEAEDQEGRIVQKIVEYFDGR
jgi:hypothetical protein